MNHLAKEAAAEWQRIEDCSGDVDGAIEALGQLIMGLSKEDAAFRTIIQTAAGLIMIYCEHGGDPTGEATTELRDQLNMANLLPHSDRDRMAGEGLW